MRQSSPTISPTTPELRNGDSRWMAHVPHFLISHRLYECHQRASGVQYTDPEHTIRCSIASSNYTRARPSTQSCPSHEVLSLTWCLELIWAAGGHFSGSGSGSCNNGNHFYSGPCAPLIYSPKPQIHFIHYTFPGAWGRTGGGHGGWGHSQPTGSCICGL